MKPSNVFWGLLLVTIGVCFLLYNFDLFYLSFGEVNDFWPVIIIMLGLALLKIPKIYKSILAGASAVYLGILTVSLLNLNINIDHDVRFKFGDNDREEYYDEADTSKIRKPGNYSISYDPSFEEAKLNFEGGAGQFRFQELTDKLLEIKTSNSSGDLQMENQGNKAYIDFLTKTQKNINLSNLQQGIKAKVKMHPKPVWDMDVNVGACQLDMDLSGYKTRDIKVNAGAADIFIKLGDFYKKTSLNMDIGVSSVVIKIPRNSGCRIITDTNFSSKNFQNFIKKSDNLYISENWEDADKKIVITIDGGISSFTINRYQ